MVVCGLIHSDLINGFGYANGIFYPQLFLYIPAILINLGIDVIDSYKIFIFIITLATAFITYFSINKITKSNKKSLLATLLYVLSMYRLGDIYVRSALGEILAFAFIPLIVLGLYEILYNNYKNWWIICLGIFGIINSHVLTAVFVLLLIFLYCIFSCKTLIKEKIRLKYLIIAGIISILLSFSFIIPYIEMTKNDLFNFEIYNNAKFLYGGASSLQELLKDNISNVGNEFSIGLVLLILPVLYFLKGNLDYKKDKFLINSYIIGLIFLILSTKIVPWKSLSMLGIIQFPFRFSIIYSMLFSYVSAEAVFKYFKSKESITIVVIAIIYITGIQISNINVNEGNVAYHEMINNYPLGLEEYLPINFDRHMDFICDIEDEPKNGEKVKKEDIDIIDFERKSSRIEFDYYKNKKMNLHIPLTYYKGYVAYLIDDSGVKHDLKLEKEDKNANIIVSSEEIISGRVIIEYKMTFLQKVSYFVSIVTSLVLLIFIFNNKEKNNTYIKVLSK